MKKIIRLTESDLARIVKRILDEGPEEDMRNKSDEGNIFLKSKAKRIFSILKDFGLKPNYVLGDRKMDKVHDAVVSVKEDEMTGSGLIVVKFWAWAVDSNDLQELESEIETVLGDDFETKYDEDYYNNDKIYVMKVRKKPQISERRRR